MRPLLFHWIIFGLVLLVLLVEIFIILEQKHVLPTILTPRLTTERLFPEMTGPPYPAQILELARWKITLPVGDPERPDEPREISQPKLTTYKLEPWFMPTPDKTGVIFRAPVNAPVTSGSDYPRSELREMTADGKENIFWSSENGTHTMLIDEAITAVPKQKPEVVSGQIHGDDDDLLAIRLDYPTLYLARGKSRLATLDENYVLGRRFTIHFVAHNGKMQVYFNNSNTPVYSLEKKVSKAYFKAGAYVQSNCAAEELSDLCDESNFGEVVIYRLTVTHE